MLKEFGSQCHGGIAIAEVGGDLLCVSMVHSEINNSEKYLVADAAKAIHIQETPDSTSDKCDGENQLCQERDRKEYGDPWCVLG